MREIKFRAWDNQAKIMLTMPFEGYYGLSIFFSICSDYYNVMQFTGLKDKNGKEIYEGDIVKRIAILYDWDKPDGEERYEREEVSFIEYRGQGFWVNSESFGWEGEGLWEWDEIEVIGNIYENKDLIGK
jgi:uncharacterized phage protein (TIGR01671 family)